MELPPETRLTRLPNNVELRTKSLSYQASYEVIGKTVKVKRAFTAQRGKSVCDQQDDDEWAQFNKVLQRDLRQQFFLE